MDCWRIRALVLVGFVGALAVGQDVQVPMASGRWRPTPEWTPHTAADTNSHTFEDGMATFRAGGGGATMIWLQSLSLGDLSGVRHVTMRYRATDIDPHLASYFLWGDAGDESRMRRDNFLFFVEDLIVDGNWHVAGTACRLKELKRLALRFAATEGATGQVQVDWIRLSAAPPRFPIREMLPWKPVDTVSRPIPLESLRSLGLAEVQSSLALSDWFDTPAVDIAGARFAIPSEGNLAVPTSKRETTEIDIPIGLTAAEVHLLMGGDFAPKLLGYHGWENGDRISRPSQFLATVHYSDGTSQEQIPFCLDRKEHGVWRGLHAYALHADPEKTIARVVIRDGATVSRLLLIAATAAESPLVPEVPVRQRVTPAGILRAEGTPSIARDEGSLRVRSDTGLVVFDLENGMAISDLMNGYHTDWPVTAGGVPLFRIRDGFKAWGADAFTMGSCEVAGDSANVHFSCAEAQVEVLVTVQALRGDEVRLGVELTNTAEVGRRLHIEAARVGVNAPDGAERLWYVYPRLGIVWSNRDRTFREAHAGYFPTQWMGVYDRVGGGGVYLMTRDTEGLFRHHVLAKHGDDVQQRIEYREQNVAAGQTRRFPAVYVGVHGGDWRAGWQRYREWLSTWQTPMVPRSDWFRRIWNFRTSWLQYFAGDKWYDAEQKNYVSKTLLGKDRELFGPVGMNHFFDWRQTKQYGRWGDYGHYHEIGGLEKFRGMIADHHGAGTRVGLYLDTYLCSKSSNIGRAHGEEWAVKRRNGTYMDSYSTKEDPLWNQCVWHPGWRDYLSTRCADVVRETGCDGVYLDEGGTDLGAYWCWREDHPHEVPGCRQTGFLELCKETRRKLPETAVLYTEHAPADIVIPYLDGAYSTALGRSDVDVTPGYVHIHRFAFPDFKLLPITSAGSISHGIWDGLRYSMFNGAALYSLSRGHDPQAFALIRKINAILSTHEDAFLTTNPEPLVDTLVRDVLCNRFPGEKETVWTLWNGRWQQFRGAVLRVPHQAGMTYVDLWNGRDLTPQIRDGHALIDQNLGARSIGVVCQTRR